MIIKTGEIETSLSWQDTTAVAESWAGALQYCESLNIQGTTPSLNEWRLPNRNVLLSIVDYNNIKPSTDPEFTNTSSDISYVYWSSTEDMAKPEDTFSTLNANIA